MTEAVTIDRRSIAPVYRSGCAACRRPSRLCGPTNEIGATACDADRHGGPCRRLSMAARYRISAPMPVAMPALSIFGTVLNSRPMRRSMSRPSNEGRPSRGGP